MIPDIVTMAKGIGNGLPLAAVVTTPEIAQTLATRLHFNTFGEHSECGSELVGGSETVEGAEGGGWQMGEQAGC